MNRLGFTSQKPIKLAYQRNPEKIKEWLTVAACFRNESGSLSSVKTGSN